MLTLASESCLANSPRAPGLSSISTSSTSRWSGDPHPCALERLPAPGNGVVVKEQVDDTPALTGERCKTANTDAGLASDLSQPGRLSRPVFENHSKVRGHRIFDPAT
jgi:hypothetical protein